jgi:hypothetical protein
MTPQEIVENIMREMPNEILLGFDLRKLVASVLNWAILRVVRVVRQLFVC